MTEWTSTWCMRHGLVWVLFTVFLAVASCGIAIGGLYVAFVPVGHAKHDPELGQLLLIPAIVLAALSYCSFVAVVPTDVSHWCAFTSLVIAEAFFVSSERFDYWTFTHILYVLDFANRFNSTLQHHQYAPLVQPAPEFGAPRPSIAPDTQQYAPEHTERRRLLLAQVGSAAEGYGLYDGAFGRTGAAADAAAADGVAHAW